VLYRRRKQLLYSFLIILVSALIGVFSLSRDQDFARLILGDAYINTTLDNINSGDPMAIYRDNSPWGMFLRIAWNNIRVAFFAFAGGILFSIGTFLILFHNGVMLGVFQYFFFKKGYALLSMSAIWMHGTIEIFSIIVAGAAGLVMGNSFLFPGTYTRAYSLRKGAKEGSLMVAGLIPFFIIAAFIESFLTYLYMESLLLDWTIIGGSMLPIIWYFFMYPSYVNRKVNNG
jgi:uncharacterized membrane protein SpoIIM required for sporulation